ncbi:tail fiber assembly protein [Escherichia coli]|uniref:tail fiber assembly protein n=1 Tax=Escherichia coli TaxID=562 RepID=UPI0017A73721|nr:tail fiber assembly protein [Escherichia coli]EFH5954784.1 tail fiber assembly protein [Escherichia coli]EFO4471986.1 tail fiber assembly protein [Escherichia coli]EHY7630071.1 tail fiber assembly protein [Escherichia coli]
MKPVFDENDLATEAGNIRCFYFDPVTFEYTGWSDEYINVGVSMPGHSTDIDPGDEVDGKIAVFTNGQWELYEDHRGGTVYSTTDASAVTVDYIGPVKDGYTILAPSGPYDKWDGEKWVTDTEAQHGAAVEAAEAQRQSLIDAAMASISLIQLKLQAGRKLTQAETTRLNAVLDYIDAVTATDTSTAPDVIWPELPEA